MSKTAKFTSIYRTQWRDAKSKSDPKVLKHCDFNKGLGPAIEKLEKALVPFQDVETIPEKPAQAITKSVIEIQKIIRKYQEDIASGNKKYPELGEDWFKLQNTLKRLDICIVDALKPFGIQIDKLTIWIDKSKFKLAFTDIPKPTGIGLYHGNWNSIVKQCAPSAIEKINFTENLGFALDQFECICDNIDESLQPHLRDQALEVQRILKIYFSEILRCKEEFPEEVLNWFNLHQALKDIDEAVCTDAEDCHEKYNVKIGRLHIWLKKDKFKSKTPGEKEEDVDFSQEVENIILHLKSHEDDPEKLIKALSHKNIFACMPYSPSKAKTLTELAARLRLPFLSAIQQINKNNFDQAQVYLEQLLDGIQEVCSVLGKQAPILEEFLVASIYTPVQKLLSEASSN